MDSRDSTSGRQELPELKLPGVGDFEQLNYFSRLGLSTNASIADVKKAYRILAVQYHPDKHQNSDESSTIFRLLTEAYKVLSNSDEAAVYQNILKNGLNEGFSDQHKYARSPKIIYKRDKPELHSETYQTAISNNYVARVTSLDGICLFFGRTGKEFKLYQRPNKNSSSRTHYYSVMISEEDNEIFAKESHGEIDVFDIQTGELKRTYKDVDKPMHAGGRDILRIDQNKSITYARGYLVELLSDGSKNTICYLGPSANSISLSKNKQFILLSYGENAFDIFDLKHNKRVVRISTGFPVYSAEMSSDGRFVACCGYKNSVSLYDLATNDVTEIPVNDDEVHTLQFSPDGKFIIIGEHNKSNILYYSIQDRVIKHEQYLNENGFIHQIYFTSNNRLVVNHHETVFNVALPDELLSNIDLIEQVEREQYALTYGETKLDESVRTITVIPPLANILVSEFKDIMGRHLSFINDKTYKAMTKLVKEKEECHDALITYHELTHTVEKAGNDACKKRLSSTNATLAVRLP